VRYNNSDFFFFRALFEYLHTSLGYYQINIRKLFYVVSLVGNWNRILYLPGTGNIIGDSRARKVREGRRGGGEEQLFPVACSILPYS